MESTVRRGWLWVGLLAALASPAELDAQTVNLRPGKYAVTTEMDIPGMRMKMPPQKTEQCIAADDLKDLSAKLAGIDRANPACRMSPVQTLGNTVSFTRTCGKVVWSSELTYSGDAFAGMTKGQDEQGRPVTSKATATRIGDCAK